MKQSVFDHVQEMMNLVSNVLNDFDSLFKRSRQRLRNILPSLILPETEPRYFDISQRIIIPPQRKEKKKQFLQKKESNEVQHGRRVCSI